MTELNTLVKIVKKSKKRIGRGYGSGKGGHTVGRGSKGQKSRGTIKLSFDGTKFKKSFIKRLPFLRGKGKFNSLRDKPVVIGLGDLGQFPDKAVVDIQALMKAGVLKKGKNLKVKVLANGKLEKSLEVNLPCSQGAIRKIEAAGGKVTFGKTPRNKVNPLVLKTERKKTKRVAEKVKEEKKK